LGRALSLAGAGSLWTGTGNVEVTASGNLTNTGTFTIQNDQRFGTTAGVGQLTNQGTLTKNGGTGTTEIRTALTNSGTVNVLTGTLQLTGGGNTTGLMNIASGSTLEIGGSTFSLL